MSNKRFAFLFVAVLLFVYYIAIQFSPKDASDDPVTGKRSGLVLLTDYGTGCQYLKTPIFGPVIPRLGSDGKPMCGIKETK